MRFALITAIVCCATATVLTTKVADVLPSGMTIELGSVAAAALLVRPMAKPPVPATLLIVTVPILVAPPIRLVGLKVIETSLGAVKVNEAV